MQQPPRVVWDALPEATRTALEQATAALQSALEQQGEHSPVIGQHLRQIQGVLAPYGLFHVYREQSLPWSQRKVYYLMQLAEVDGLRLGLDEAVLVHLTRSALLELTAPALSAAEQQALIAGLNTGQIAPQVKAIQAAKRQGQTTLLSAPVASEQKPA